MATSYHPSMNSSVSRSTYVAACRHSMGIEWRAHCARARVCADRAAGVTSVTVRVSSVAARNSMGRGLSVVVKAAAHAVHMSVAVVRSSSGASI